MANANSGCTQTEAKLSRDSSCPLLLSLFFKKVCELRPKLWPMWLNRLQLGFPFSLPFGHACALFSSYMSPSCALSSLPTTTSGQLLSSDRFHGSGGLSAMVRIANFEAHYSSCGGGHLNRRFCVRANAGAFTRSGSMCRSGSAGRVDSGSQFWVLIQLPPLDTMVQSILDCSPKWISGVIR